MHTDGSVAVIRLQTCKAPGSLEPKRNASYKPGNHVFRFMRRQILTLRNDMLRANIIYGAYDVGRMTFMALRKPTIQPVIQPAR